MDELQAKVDMVASDMDVANGQIEATFDRIRNEMRATIKADIEDIQAAYQLAVTELAEKIHPFRGPEHEQSKMRFMTELNLLGGAGRNRHELIERTNAALDSKDSGAVQFFHKNFRTLYDRLASPDPQKNPPVGAEDAVIARIEDAYVGQMDRIQRMTYDRLQNLKKSWKEAGMESGTKGDLDFALHTANGGMNIPFKARPRTQKEMMVAAERERIRYAKNRLNELGD